MTSVFRKALTVIGVLAVAALVVLAAILVFAPQSAPPEPTPTATLQPEPEPTETSEPTESGHDGHLDGHDCTEEEIANAGPMDDCTPGSTLTAEDYAAAAAHLDAVQNFVTQWVTYTPDETQTARADRLMAAGASAELTAQPSEISRPETSLVELTTSSGVKEILFALPIDRDPDGTSYAVSLNVYASYRLPTNDGTDQLVGGTVTVWLNDSGVVTKVVEDFPGLRDLR